MAPTAPPSKDFFISYNRHDKQWAEWIAWTLEEAGYSVVIQSWDFRPGGNFVLDMQRASVECEKTIAVLSEHYLQSEYTQSEWSAAFAGDPQSLKRTLIPMRVGECRPEGVLKTIVYVDLVSVTDAATAKQLVLNALKERAKPDQEPTFPGTVPTSERTEPEPVEFPGVESIDATPAIAAVVDNPTVEVSVPEPPQAKAPEVETPAAEAPTALALEADSEPDPTPDQGLLLGLTRRELISGFVVVAGMAGLGRFFLTAPAKSVLPPAPVKPSPTPTPTPTVKPTPEAKPISLPTTSDLKLQFFDFTVVTVNEKGEKVKAVTGMAKSFQEDLGNEVGLEMVCAIRSFEMSHPTQGKRRSLVRQDTA